MNARTLVLSVALAAAALAPASAQQPRLPDVIFVPTPTEVVDAMLKLAKVSKSDVVYDLGSGDGRIPIAAAVRYGARGVGVDLDPKRIEEANENAKAAGVAGKVSFIAANVFDTDFRDATVVFLYMSLDVNQRLMPKLKSLKPGARVVSHAFDMGPGWPPDERGMTDGRSYYLWVIRD